MDLRERLVSAAIESALLGFAALDGASCDWALPEKLCAASLPGIL